MKPVPETREALGEIVSLEDPDLDELLDALGRAARRIVPELVGLSLGLAREGLTFTLVASDEEVATLDAAQYLSGGPCVQVGEGRRDIAQVTVGDPLDEESWRLFADANAARNVASTLSLPLHSDAELVGSLNLYAATADAFGGGRVEQLARLAGAVPTAAVMNADLSFSTRLEAAAAPERLRDRNTIETAIGLVAGDKRITTEDAHQQLQQAAARAGLHLIQVARVVIAAFRRR